MGKTDQALKEYFSDPRRYADLWNAGLFQGRQLLCPEDLQEGNPGSVYGSENEYWEHTGDLAMKQFQGKQVLALWILENQENTDYHMPARIMVQEALQYARQLKDIQRENRRAYQSSRKRKPGHDSGGPYYKDTGEFLYHFRKQDRLFPVITLAAYWGDGEWNGPLTLHDMLDLSGNDELKKAFLQLIPEYPLHLINLSKLEDYGLFRTELRTLLELYSCRTDKNKLIRYLENHDECRHMDKETCHALGIMTHSKVLQTIKPQETEETINMCKAIDDLIQEGRIEGETLGKIAGEASGLIKGEARMAQLAQLLIDAGQLSVLTDALRDIQLRNQLFQQYQLL